MLSHFLLLPWLRSKDRPLEMFLPLCEHLVASLLISEVIYPVLFILLTKQTFCCQKKTALRGKCTIWVQSLSYAQAHQSTYRTPKCACVLVTTRGQDRQISANGADKLDWRALQVTFAKGCVWFLPPASAVELGHKLTSPVCHTRCDPPLPTPHCLRHSSTAH